jgi:hypothetical protein
MLSGDPAYFFNRFDRANFIICVHDADENSFRRHRVAQIVRIDPTVMIDGEIGHFGAEPLQKLAGRDRCRVFDRTCDDVIPPVLEREDTPLRARLFASLPPLVKITSSAAHPRRLATSRRAFSSAVLAGIPAQ